MVADESGGGKRRRLCIIPSVVDWVEELPFDMDPPKGSLPCDSDSDFVIRLSGTPRRLSDPVLENRDCIALAKESKDPRRSTLEEILGAMQVNLSYVKKGLSDPLVCSEAYKLLEKDFSDFLKTTCSLREHEDTVEDVTGIIKVAAKQQNWPITKTGWVKTISFGVFAEAVLMLNTADVEGVVGKRGKIIFSDLKSKITDIFWTVLEEGISLLSGDKDTKIQEAISFLLNRENLIPTLEEWVACSRLRMERNSIGHCFSTAASHDMRRIAIEYYDTVLKTSYSESFRHVGELGKLKLELPTTSSASRAVNNELMDELKMLLPGISEDEAEDEGSSDSSDT